jgi:hypothetical protein
MGISYMTTTRPRATARLAARFGKLSRLAVLSSTATVAVVALGVTGAASPDAAEEQATRQAADLSAAAPIDLEHFAELREGRVSRTAPRVALEPKPSDHKFATADLNLWTAPREQGKRHGLVQWGTKIAVTGQVVGHWAEVLTKDGKKDVVRWVNADYLANKKPKPAKPAPASTPASSSSSSAPAPVPSTGGACTNGTSVSGSPNVIAVHRAVCANWPSITSYGTYRADSGDHGSGRAIDIMISGATGWEIAEFVRANASSLGVSYIIYSQKIWSVDRAGEGWRYMSSRGSATADHYDHVHVSTY